ncbi:MAG: PAS domain S-box protein, partial [Candidatus Sericytochromatia bacterium]|nr:PAS domain S-box protein [Candidatus Sericytochromatia bacterium]
MTQPWRVLIVGDSPTDAERIGLALRRDGRDVETARVADAGAMRTALETQPWDAIICAWSMPRFSALVALDLMQQRGLDLPFVIVSGTLDDAAAAEAMRAGAHDVLRPDGLTRLVPAIERELRAYGDRAARRQAERALGASEARFARLTECAMFGIVVMDMDGDILDVNDAFVDILGYTRDDLLVRKLWRTHATPPEWLPMNEWAIGQLRTVGVTRPWEKEFWHADGHRVPVLVGSAMLDDTRYIAFVADLSERKRIEAALQRSEGQLRQAHKMEAVGRLAGGVAHDFNNLLSVILTYAEMLRSDLAPEDPIGEDLTEIITAGERAAELTRQLLMFSRRQVLAFRILDLNTVLTGMDKMLRHLVGEDITVAVSLAPACCRIKADPGSLERVILNLVVNAREAMPAGGRLTVATAAVDLDEAFAHDHHGVVPGPHVMLAVSDTGIGMDQDIAAQIFEPFFTTKAQDKGTGLGLSTALGIVQQNGGSIWVDSEPGVGATFRVYLPYMSGQIDAEQPPMPPAPQSGTET